MSIPATEAVTRPGCSPRARPTADERDHVESPDKDMFLQLLVAQMRYQDPMNPTDSSQFLAQSAQFTALEKMQDVADQTAALLLRPDGLRRQRPDRQAGHLDRRRRRTQSGVVNGVTFGADGPVLDVAGPSSRSRPSSPSPTAPATTSASA